MISLLPLVLAGHLVGDWIFQTDKQAANKAKPGLDGGAAMIRHVATYSLALGAATLWPLWGRPLAWWLLVLVSAGTHAVIDRRWPVRWLMRVTRSPMFAEQMWGAIATDQALHLSILCVLVAVVAR